MPRTPLLMLLVFALTLFASATLLFLVEPMIGKMITPLLGGTPAVWNTCMVFFQAVLLVGYTYAHLSTTWLGARKQAVLHLALLLVPFVSLPIIVNRGLIHGDENPVLLVLLILSLSVGLPMFVVSASAPLLQKWFANTSHPAARDPYFLYGASNLGSMLALLAYPTVVEPHLRLAQQSFDWTVGYGLLVALTAVCAVFLWLSPPAANKTVAEEAAPSTTAAHSSEAIQPSRQRVTTGRGKGKGGKSAAPAGRDRRDAGPTNAGPTNAGATDLSATTLTGAVTWKRIARWVALAFVPSSLMLGVTTYITTDIAAIPLLWVLPLALYLLSFIVVFSKPWLQRLSIAVASVLIAVALGILFWNLELSQSGPILRLVLRLLIFLGGGGGAFGVWWSWKSRDSNLLHRIVLLLLPLVVLTLLFLTLSEAWRPPIGWRIGMHLGVLFLVALFCHGELARDRPAAVNLTGYYLWMSVGGVAGGLFNALFAPVAFNAIVEYQLALVLACLLMPPLGPMRESLWGRRADAVLAVLFASVGALLIVLRLRDHDLNFELLKAWPWGWTVAAVLLALGGGAWLALRNRDKPLDSWLDLVLPACLAVLVIGLYWGLWSDAVWGRMRAVAQTLHTEPGRLRMVLTIGVPVIMCYTFVERSYRFALGLGAILLGVGLGSFMEDSVLHQERSFFGVLKIENLSEPFDGERFAFRRLIHGTTMHGKQHQEEALRDFPTSYYHPSGPVGQIMEAYNQDGKRNLAVIGLGTGTMACYARPGQHLTFYDIDPVVRRLSFDEDKPYFSFVQDARRRGAHLDLVMGDARLTMERQQLSPTQKYGIIVVDAFSSDAIPVHLITREALQVYLDKMTEDGILTFHISNRYLDLRPVLANLARDRGLATLYQSDEREQYPGKARSSWVVLARKDKYLDNLRALNDWSGRKNQFRKELLQVAAWPSNGGGGLAAPALVLARFLDQEPCQERPYSRWDDLKPAELADGSMENWPDEAKVGVWTDDYSNLLSVFSW